jgi:hypothetical protein
MTKDKKEYFKKYYVDHKDDILEKGKATYKCECGKIVTYYNSSRHNKSKLHHRWLDLNKKD